MRFYGCFRNRTHSRDHFVRIASNKRFQDLLFPLRKAVGAVTRGISVLRQQAASAGHRSGGRYLKRRWKALYERLSLLHRLVDDSARDGRTAHEKNAEGLAGDQPQGIDEGPE